MSEWETSLKNGNQYCKDYCGFFISQNRNLSNRTNNSKKKEYTIKILPNIILLFFNLYFWMSDLLTKYKQKYKQQDRSEK